MTQLTQIQPVNFPLNLGTADSLYVKINISNDNTAPYLYAWDTTVLENGSEHTISASITDVVGHQTILQPVLVTVSN